MRPTVEEAYAEALAEGPRCRSQQTGSPLMKKKKPGNVTLYTSFQRWILPELHVKKRKLLHLHARFRFSLMRNIYFFTKKQRIIY
jgi:hypothetical protein